VAVLPAVVVSVMVLPAAMRLRTKVHLTGIDRFFIAYLFFRLASLAVNPSGGFGLALDTLAYVALPYVAFRMLSTQAGIRAAMAVGIVAGGIVSAVIAVREYNGVKNPFIRYIFGGYQYAFYAKTDRRFGRPRPEAAFGQAVPLGMFLALAAVIALAFAWRASTPWRRSLSYASALVVLAGLTNTLVRGPLIMVAVGVGMLLFGDVRRFRLDRAVLVVVAGAVLLTIGTFGTNVFRLRDASSEAGSQVQQSGEVRFEIFDAVMKPENFSLFGKTAETGEEVGFQEAVGQQVGLRSFENAFALTYLGYGVLALIAFVGIALLVFRASFLSGLDMVDRGWCAAFAGVFVNLLGVGLVAQFIQLFWIGVAVIASIVQVSASAKRSVSSSAPGTLR
jgi:hypothetical protein